MRTELNKLIQGDIVTFYYYELRLVQWDRGPNGKTIDGFQPKVYSHKELKATKFWYLGTFALTDKEAKGLGGYDIYKLFCDENGRYVRVFQDDWNKRLNIHEDTLNYRHTMRYTQEELDLIEDLLSTTAHEFTDQYQVSKTAKVLLNRVRSIQSDTGEVG